MALTEEQKYAKKAEMLKRALAAADEMDKKDAEKEKSARAKKRTQTKAEKEQQRQQAEKDSEPVQTGS